jgi:hypothetical protein
VDVSLKTYGLGPISGYLHKYLGRELGSGLFNYEGGFKIENKILNGKNDFTLDHFKLAGKVESPEAIKLPVDFAIALLTDRQGQINLEKIEIQGDYNEPGVKTGPLIMQTLGKVLGNMITKAVTSPFSFLAKVAGGGEDLQSTTFELSQTDLSSDMLKKLESISQLLIERPLIKLSINSVLARHREEEPFKLAKAYLALLGKTDITEPLHILKAYQPADFEQRLRSTYTQHLIASANLKLAEQKAAASGNQLIDIKQGLSKLGNSIRGVFKNSSEAETAAATHSDNTMISNTPVAVATEIDMDTIHKEAAKASLAEMVQAI